MGEGGKSGKKGSQGGKGSVNVDVEVLGKFYEVTREALAEAKNDVRSTLSVELHVEPFP